MATCNATTNRAAFREISRLSPMETRNNSPNTPTRNHVNILPDSYLTPSPDEQVIRLRGRRKIGVTFDESNKEAEFNSDALLKSPKTPTKKNTPRPRATPTRTSPRKRLQLSEAPSPPETPVKLQKTAKQLRLHKNSYTGSIHSAVQSLTHDQLVNTIKKLMIIQPNVELVLNEILPPPDLEPLQNRLQCLLRNIYKSFPRSRWDSRQDAYCYRYVSGHIQCFKKECLEQCRHFVDCQQWSTVIDYVLVTWKQIVKLPNWDSPDHNKAKQQCFRVLASHCLTALKQSNLEKDYYEDIKKRLKVLVDVNKELEPCLKFVEEHLNAL